MFDHWRVSFWGTPFPNTDTNRICWLYSMSKIWMIYGSPCYEIPEVVRSLYAHDIPMIWLLLYAFAGYVFPAVVPCSFHFQSCRIYPNKSLLYTIYSNFRFFQKSSKIPGCYSKKTDCIPMTSLFPSSMFL